MKAVFIYVGKTNESYISDGLAVYLKRLQHYIPVTEVIVTPSTLKDKRKAMIEESDSILKKLKAGDFLVVLDEGGISIDSRQFSKKIQQWMVQGISRLVFVTGGSYGIDATLKEKAGMILSMSKFTFTHQMVRLILAEQLYRAMTIANNEKYHHD